jgi:IclR family acetate operon transcriptional repressor
MEPAETVTDEREVIPRAQTRSLHRGLQALEFVAQAGEVSVSEVATALGLPRASAHILLSTLADAGYLRQAKRRGRYGMDLRVLLLANAVLRRMPVRDRAAPLLHELASTTGLAAYLGVLSRDDVVTVDRIVPTPRPEARADLGVANPAYASSMGKAILAFLPPRELESYLASVELQPITERTITSIDQLRTELDQVRARGYAVSEGEHRPNVRSVAAPIFSYSSEVVAAVCVRHYLPADQSPDATLTEALISIAQRISHTLGYGADGQ